MDIDLLGYAQSWAAPLAQNALVALIFCMFTPESLRRPSRILFASALIGVVLDSVLVWGLVWCMPIAAGFGFTLRSWWLLRKHEREKLAKGDTQWTWIIKGRLAEMALVLAINAGSGLVLQKMANDLMRDVVGGGMVMMIMMGFALVALALIAMFLGVVTSLKAMDAATAVEFHYRYPSSARG